MTQAIARRLAEQINFQIIAALAARRVRHGDGAGDRAAIGGARPAHDLCEFDDGSEVVYSGVALVMAEVSGPVVTRPGIPATRRRVPVVVRRLPEGDARRMAAELYARAMEKIGSMAGASAEGGKMDGGPATNDGGVTTRIEFAGVISAAEKAWRGAGVALRADGRGGAGRRDITALELMRGVCVDGHGMRKILTRAGWSGHSRDAAALNVFALERLEDAARALALVAASAPRPVATWSGRTD